MKDVTGHESAYRGFVIHYRYGSWTVCKTEEHLPVVTQLLSRITCHDCKKAILSMLAESILTPYKEESSC